MSKIIYTVRILSARLLILLFVWQVISPPAAHSQRVPFRVYGEKDRFLQSQINGIVQDEAGYLWIATAEGVSRFDGEKFTHFNKKDGLAGSMIEEVFIDSRGDIWFGHRAAGLTRYHKNRQIFEKVVLPSGFEKAIIRDIAETKNGDLYFATRQGLLCSKENDWSVYDSTNGLSPVELNALCADGDRLWIGSETGLQLFDPRQKEGGQIRPIQFVKDKRETSVSAMTIDHQGRLWLGTSGGGIFSQKQTLDSLLHLNAPEFNSHPEFPIVTTQIIFADRDGHIWFGCKEKGLIRYDPDSLKSIKERFSFIDSKNGLSRNDITAIFEDKEGSLWFGTNGGGLHQFRGRFFEQYGKPEGLADEVIWSIYEDKKGRFWFGCEQGLMRVENIDGTGGRLQTRLYDAPEWGGNRSVIDMTEGYDGKIWLVVHRSGVSVLNPASGHIRPLKALSQKNITSIARGNNQDLWFGTFYNGVFKLDQKSGQLTNYQEKDGLGSNTIFSIIRAKNNDIWFATNHTGITRFNGTSFEIYDTKKGLPASSVLSLAEDSRGRLWIGSEGEGLFLYDGHSFQNYSEKYGIWDEDIYSIVCDENDHLFIGTRRGIEKIDLKSGYVNKYRFFEIETNQNAVLRDSRNRIWFGAVTGVIRYNPDEDYTISTNPAASIDKIRVYLEDVPLPEDARFSHTDNHLTFYFSSISFIAPKEIRYAYTMEGLDRGWTPPTTENNATYANLSPGNYKFRVKTMNQDGRWSETDTSYTFSIATPVWQTSWFYFILIAVTGASVYGIHLFQVRKISRNNQWLEKIVHARTVDIVTEKEKAQAAYDALRESENKLRQVTSSIDAYLWSLGIAKDQTLESTFITDTFFNIIGYNKSDLPPAKHKIDRFFKIVHPEDQFLAREAYKSALTGNTINVSFRILCKDQSYQWHYIHCFPVKDKEGNVNLIHGVGFDVTNRKLAEQALRKSEEKYATFMRYSTEAIWCLDLNQPIPVELAVDEQIDLIYKYAYLADSNDAMANLYGYESAIEIIGLPVNAGLLKDNQENRAYLKRFVEAGYRLKNAEFDEIDRHGEKRVMLAGFVGIIERDCLVRCWGMQSDITQKKLAEQALKESEEMYRRLIERSPDAIIVHSEGIIDYINESGIKMYGGSSANQFIGRKLTEFSHPNFRELGRKRIKQIYTEKKEVSLMEQKMIRCDGSEFDVEVMGAPVIYKGKACGQSIVRDITGKKKMEEELQKSQKLESVGLLAGGIAHDFNNILTAILGNISLAKMYSDSASEACSVLSQAEKATIQAKDLTQQLLTFSKGGAPIRKTTSIFEVVKESTDFVLRGSSIDAVYQCVEDLWSVDVDAAQISQVIQNLIINAEQAMPDGKRISVGLKNIEWSSDTSPGLKPGRYVEIEIADQGIGIPEEHLPKIFDPYFTTKQKGSGLGLATTYSIIQKHEGHIRVTSQIGKGTRVIIYIPASQRSISKGKPADEHLHNGKGKILVMDDEEMLRHLAQQFLGHLGYKVITVSDGENAINEYQRAREEGLPFSLVIMDLTIPGGMGGKETIEQLRRIDPDVRAIVSSGYSNDPVLSNFKDYGFQAVLPKPYKIETLSTLISKITNGHSVTS